jgi:hypothetical protein
MSKSILKLCLTISILLSLSISCKNKEQPPIELPKIEVAPDQQQTASTIRSQWNGAIGTNVITMHIECRGSIITGNYFYDKIGTPISLTGRIAHDSVQMHEFTNNNDTTGSFDGTLLNDSTISGIWKKQNSKTALRFYVSSAANNPCIIAFREFHGQNCQNVVKDKKLVENYWDTLCSTIDLDILSVILNSKTIADKINRQIIQVITASDEPDAINKYLSTFDDEGGVEKTISCNVITNSAHILAVNIMNYEYYFGAAHPSTSCTYKNFDLKTGDELSITSILNSGYESTLDSLIRGALAEQYDKESLFIEEKDTLPSGQVSITPDGIQILYNQYEIGPYVIGMPEVIVSYAQLMPWLKKDVIPENWIQ